MPGTATPTKPVSSPSAAEGAASREREAVEYPERHWIAQSIWHGDAVRMATDALLHHFRAREDVLVAMELAVYYKRGDRTVWLQPDVQVVFGVRRGGNRRSFRVWEQGKAPDFVLEVASPSTAGRDAREKVREYARIGVREYWRLDPQGTLMGEALEGYVCSAGRYDTVQPVGSWGRMGYLRSRVLGLDLRSRSRDGATVLVFRDPRTGEEFDGTLEEAERRRRIAERERRSAEERAAAAERQVRQEARLRRAAEDRASAAEAQVGELKERLRNLATATHLLGRDK